MDLMNMNVDWSKYMFDNIATQSRRDQGLSDNDNPLVNLITDTNSMTPIFERSILTKENYKDNKQSVIFFTINPCNEYWEGKTKEMFRSELVAQFRIILSYYKRYKQLPLLAEIHFEESDRVHSHGEIHGFPLSYQGYNVELTYISKRLHKVFGRPRLNSNICAKLVWTNEQWNGKYCLKSEIMRPARVSYL